MNINCKFAIRKTGNKKQSTMIFKFSRLFFKETLLKNYIWGGKENTTTGPYAGFTGNTTNEWYNRGDATSATKLTIYLHARGHAKTKLMFSIGFSEKIAPTQLQKMKKQKSLDRAFVGLPITLNRYCFCLALNLWGPLLPCSFIFRQSDASKSRLRLQEAQIWCVSFRHSQSRLSPGTRNQ